MTYLLPKTIEKRFKDTNISQEKIDLLHKYLLAATNLYGIRDDYTIYNIMLEYGEDITLEEFNTLMDIIYREENKFLVKPMDEFFDEYDENAHYLIYNKILNSWFSSWKYLYDIAEGQEEHDLFLPENKEDYLAFCVDPFYNTSAGKKFKNAVETLTTSGIGIDFSNKKFTMIDINGEKITNKKISSVIYVDSYEKFLIDHERRKNIKKAYQERYYVTLSDRILMDVKLDILSGNMNDGIKDFLESLNELGVRFRGNAEVNRFMKLYQDLNNTSNVWYNNGWTPSDYSKYLGPRKIESVSFGPGIQKMIESGEIDEKELMKFFKENGINVIK